MTKWFVGDYEIQIAFAYVGVVQGGFRYRGGASLELELWF